MPINPMAVHEKYQQGAAALLSALAQGNGLQAIVEAGYELLGNPISISDKSWKSLALVPDIDLDDTVWREFREVGFLSLNTVTLSIKEKLSERIEQSELPFIWKDSYMKYPRLFGKVAIGQKLAATLAVVEYNKPFTESDIQLAAFLCDAVSSELQKNKALLYTRGSTYEEFLVDLLEGRIKSSTLIDEKVNFLNLHLKKFLYLLSINIKEFDEEFLSVSYIRNLLENMISDSKAVVYNDDIVLLTSYAHKNDIEESIAEIYDFLKKYNIRCGLSRCFFRLEDLQRHYFQSLEALKLGTHMDGDKFVYSYDDYAVYHIAKICTSYGDLQQFCHPSLQDLINYDRKYGTAFTKSLYHYLRNSRNITDTANALHIHRNSMVYHLKRIEEILGISMTDYEKLLHLELSFKFLEYEKKLMF